ncbi:L-lactate permease [Sphingomonas sp. DBB INV C78]|uniref:L-lactate permease n=1 Tax=Sphingomonas sp. DBB INV C78 TaxID=3349434 RepID=UPI0036D30BED
MIWSQNYDPTGTIWTSALIAGVPLIVLLGSIGLFHIRAHVAALLGLASALLIATLLFAMPPGLALRAVGLGAAYGLLPIGWIVLNIMFLYRLTETTGQFQLLRKAVATFSPDSRVQLLLVAFCFGAFFEGAAGFGTPVAVSGAMLIGLGFTRLQASGLSLIANTAPVAFGALGTPIVTLAGVTGLPLHELSAMVGRQMTPFAVIVPIWLMVAYCGWGRTKEVLPVVLVAGVTFGTTQLLISNLHGPWLTSIGASIASILALVAFLRIWQPRTIMPVTAGAGGDDGSHAGASGARDDGPGDAPAIAGAAALRRAWLPWIALILCVFIWGLPAVKSLLDGIFSHQIAVPGLHEMVQRMPPVVAAPEAEKAIFNLNLLSATGTAIFVASILGACLLGVRPAAAAKLYGQTLLMVWPSLLTIAAMLGLGYLTRYSGIDASMGLAFAATGPVYPLFGTMLGWLGVAVTGSDTASNVLFGGLQKVTANQLGLSPILMAGANSAGGVMGKMIDAQSIVVASTATNWFGQEGRILRYVALHSLLLGLLVALFVTLQAYVWPFTLMVPQG